MNLTFIRESLPEILKALPVTLSLAVLAGIMGWVIGFLFALIRNDKIPVASQLVTVLVSFLRGVPTVVLLYVSYFALPRIVSQAFPGIDLTKIPAFTYALFALGLNQAAYASEIFRAAIGAVDNGQIEGAYSVNMTRFQAMIHIILPQALVVALPNMGNMFLGLVQETSLAFYVGVNEIMAVTQNIAEPGLNFLEGYIILTVIYEFLSLITGKGFRKVENHIGVYRWKAAELKTVKPVKQNRVL
jgi:His/Glu/Gln/Arg/opine family amino acid ABC transporter permease subunit